MKDKKVVIKNNELFTKVIDDLLIDESLKNQRLEYLKKLGITKDNKPKVIILDILKTAEMVNEDNSFIEEITKRNVEIEFEDEFILDRDIALILVDYMVHANHSYYREQDYYKELVRITLE